MHLDANHPEQLQVYLVRKGWLDTSEAIQSLTRPGEGNMNYTLRVTTDRRSVIVKQARPYVEKYPTIAAPTQRAEIEGRFYQRIATNPDLSALMPTLLGMDADESLLVLEDLGNARDYTYLYQGSTTGPAYLLNPDDVRGLTHFLSVLHNQFRSDQPDPAFTNGAMRSLNAEHMFQYPFLADNGFDLDTIQAGLQAVAMPYKQRASLKKAVTTLADQYIHNNHAGFYSLLHGDYYPGSWLQTTTGTRVIDPEFCFYGPAEFDLGVLVAHLQMARQPEPIIQQVLTQYDRPPGFKDDLLWQFTGVEIMRRLIGLAQLPLTLTLTEKERLLEKAQQLLIG